MIGIVIFAHTIIFAHIITTNITFSKVSFIILFVCLRAPNEPAMVRNANFGLNLVVFEQ